MQIIIRQANASDSTILATLNAAVQAIHADAEPQRYKAANPDDAEVIAFFDKHLASENTYIFIAEENGEAVGYFLALHQEVAENAFVFARNRLQIDHMSVNLSHRRKGIGHLLMQKALELARELQVDYISLGVRGFNEEAIAFYKREGFETLSFNMWQKLK
jgi:ribosomal protein S18 acetylase RimI-like enzyme